MVRFGLPSNGHMFLLARLALYASDLYVAFASTALRLFHVSQVIQDLIPVQKAYDQHKTSESKKREEKKEKVPYHNYYFQRGYH